MTVARKLATPTVQLETERVIVTEWRFEADAETSWHRHAYDYVVIPQTTGQLLIQTAEGESIVELVSGKSYARSQGVEHNVINHNDYPFVFVEVELK